MRRAARTVPFGEQTIAVLAPEHLTVCKAVFDRPKDWLDIEQILVCEADLDVGEIERWLSRIVGPPTGAPSASASWRRRAERAWNAAAGPAPSAAVLLACLGCRLPSVSLTFAPAARTAPAFGFDAVTTSAARLSRLSASRTLPSLQWARSQRAPRSAERLALESSAPCTARPSSVALAGVGSATIPCGDCARTANVCLPPLTR